MNGWQIIDLPKPISTNALFANVAGRGRVRSAAYRTWLRAAGWMVKAAHPKQVRGEAELMLTVCNSYRGDLDNTFKAVLDILQECAVVINDKQFVRLTVQRGPVEGMRAEIRAVETQRAAA